MATQRGYYREELERAIDNVEMALTHLSRVVEAYAKPHPPISRMALEIGNALVTMAELIKKLHDEI